MGDDGAPENARAIDKVAKRRVGGNSGALAGEHPRFEGEDGFESASADGNVWERPSPGEPQFAASRPRPAPPGRGSTDRQGIHSAYLELLDQNLKEQAYQSFIETNTRLVPREFVLNHGIWCDLVFRKLPLGSDYVCDFAFLTKGSVQWRLVLVEIERPDKKFFSGSTLDLHRDFTKAIEQVSNWRSVLPGNLTHFVQQTLGLVTTFPQIEERGDVRFVLVYGRRSEFGDNAKRRKKIAAQQRPDLRIMSFDSLVEEPAPRGELYVAVRHNEFIDILSDRFVSEGLFALVEPENVQIGARLMESARLALEQSYNYVEIANGRDRSKALAALRRVRTRDG